jgi:hypothetical protein
MEIFRIDLEPSYFKKVGTDLIYPRVFDYATPVFVLNPTEWTPANGQITSKAQLDSEKTEFSGDLTVLASNFQDSSWTSSGWNLSDLDTDIQNFYDSNLIFEESSNTVDNPGVNCIVVKKNIDGTDYTVVFLYVGNQNSLQEIFNYSNFSSTIGLNLVSTSSITDNYIYITNTSAGDVGNVWTTESTNYNRSFELFINFECSGGTGADGFCVQWYDQNNINGGTGGGVGFVNDPDAIHAVLFPTWAGIGGSQIKWFKNNVQQVSELSSISFRQNVYYWLDYDHSAQTMKVSYSTSNNKPVSANHTFNSFVFDSNSYFFGVGAATGGSTDNHILKSMSLSFI